MLRARPADQTALAAGCTGESLYVCTCSRNRHGTHLLLRLILRGLGVRLPLSQLRLRLQKALHEARRCLIVLCLHSSILAT